MKVRMATAGDAESIHQIALDAFKIYEKNSCSSAASGALNETIEDIIKDINEKNVFILTNDDGTPIGSARVTITGEQAYFSRFCVSSKHNSQGGGQLILDEVDKFLAGTDVKKLYLHTASKVAHLIKFYYSNGFYVESTSTDRGYIRALLCKEY